MSQTKVVQADRLAHVESLTRLFDGKRDFFFTDFRGLSVEKLHSLRTNLRKNSAFLRVVKNRAALRAFEKLNYKELDRQALIGPTAVIYTESQAEVNTVARILLAFINENENAFVLKGGLVEREYLNAPAVMVYASLPTRLEGIASLLGVLNGALYKFMAALRAVSEKKSE